MFKVRYRIMDAVLNIQLILTIRKLDCEKSSYFPQLLRGSEKKPKSTKERECSQTVRQKFSYSLTVFSFLVLSFPAERYVHHHVMPRLYLHPVLHQRRSLLRGGSTDALQTRAHTQESTVHAGTGLARVPVPLISPINHRLRISPWNK